MDKDQGMARLAAEAMETVALAQAIGLGVLRAEMEALTRLLPGQAAVGAAVGAQVGAQVGAEARLAAEAAEIEAGFDNMPV